MVQQHVSLNAALGPAELRPRKHLEAQADRCRIERQQLVFETELPLAQPQALFFAKPPQDRVKQFLVKFRRPMLVGVRQGGFIRGRPDSQVNQFAKATGKPVADLAQGIGMSQLAWQNSIATNWVLQVKPLAPRSAPCFFTSAANSKPGKCRSS